MILQHQYRRLEHTNGLNFEQIAKIWCFFDAVKSLILIWIEKYQKIPEPTSALRVSTCNYLVIFVILVSHWWSVMLGLLRAAPNSQQSKQTNSIKAVKVRNPINHQPYHFLIVFLILAIFFYCIYCINLYKTSFLSKYKCCLKFLVLS